MRGPARIVRERGVICRQNEMGNFRVFRGERKTKRGEGGEGFRIEDFEKDDWGDLPRSISLLPPLLLLQFLSHPVCWLCLGPKRIMINGTGSRSIRIFEEEKFGRTKKKGNRLKILVSFGSAFASLGIGSMRGGTWKGGWLE